MNGLVVYGGWVEPPVLRAELDKLQEPLLACRDAQGSWDWDMLVRVDASGALLAPRYGSPNRPLEGPQSDCVDAALREVRLSPAATDERRFVVSFKFADARGQALDRRSSKYGALVGTTGIRVKLMVAATDPAHQFMEDGEDDARAAIAACYQAAAPAGNHVTRFEAAINVQATGSVDGLAFAPKQDDALHRCVAAALAKLRFPCASTRRTTQAHVVACAFRDQPTVGP